MGLEGTAGVIRRQDTGLQGCVHHGPHLHVLQVLDIVSVRSGSQITLSVVQSGWKREAGVDRGDC